VQPRWWGEKPEIVIATGIDGADWPAVDYSGDYYKEQDKDKGEE
jgi:hypothetical protein